MRDEKYKNRRGESLDTTFHLGTKNHRLVILGHGVTGNKDRPLLISLAERLSALGWPCLRISSAGCGGSEGRFEDWCITKNSEDLTDIIASLPQEIDLAYCGHSMGGAVGVVASVGEPRIKVLVSLAGMVKTKAFYEREFAANTPGKDVMWEDRSFPLSKTFADDLRGRENTLKELRSLTIPHLLIHGTKDDVVLPEDSDFAFDTMRCPKQILRVTGAEHSFGEPHEQVIAKEMHTWLEKHLIILSI